MRNPSRNTIKRIMRIAKYDQDNGFFFSPWIQNENTPESHAAYFLFNNVGARLYTMSKGKICNRSLKGLSKYYSS